MDDETIGELHDRLPPGWTNLPEYGVQVRPFRAVGACPHGPHRGPQGPNEDLSQCPTCWAPSWALRPPDETYGTHLPDCSLPARHESYCKPGGAGHPQAARIRGYWPAAGQRIAED